MVISTKTCKFFKKKMLVNGLTLYRFSPQKSWTTLFGMEFNFTVKFFLEKTPKIVKFNPHRNLQIPTCNQWVVSMLSFGSPSQTLWGFYKNVKLMGFLRVLAMLCLCSTNFLDWSNHAAANNADCSWEWVGWYVLKCNNMKN